MVSNSTKRISAQTRFRPIGLVLSFYLLVAGICTGATPMPEKVGIPKPVTFGEEILNPGWVTSRSQRPSLKSRSKISLSAGANPLISSPEDLSLAAGIQQKRIIILEWPRKVRIGDAQIINLTFAIDDQGNLSQAAEMYGSGAAIEPNLVESIYDTHRVVAEARLDIAGLEYEPAGEINTALLPNQSPRFVWHVRANEAGNYSGTVWLHLRYIAKEGGEEERKLLSAQIIEIEAVKLCFLDGKAARVLGSVGLVLGSVLGLDILFSWLLGYHSILVEK